MDGGNIGLEYKLAFSMKGVPRLRLLTLAPKKRPFLAPFQDWCWFWETAGHGGARPVAFYGEYTDLKSICEIDLWGSFQGLKAKMDRISAFFCLSII